MPVISNKSACQKNRYVSDVLDWLLLALDFNGLSYTLIAISQRRRP